MQILKIFVLPINISEEEYSFHCPRSVKEEKTDPPNILGSGTIIDPLVP